LSISSRDGLFGPELLNKLDLTRYTLRSINVCYERKSKEKKEKKKENKKMRIKERRKSRRTYGIVPEDSSHSPKSVAPHQWQQPVLERAEAWPSL
jgi:hypothetical protein